jgi:hypothetical protein
MNDPAVLTSVTEGNIGHGAQPESTSLTLVKFLDFQATLEQQQGHHGHCVRLQKTAIDGLIAGETTNTFVQLGKSCTVECLTD